MSDAVDRGITVTEIAAMDQPIDVLPETTAAFVGRALRGPLDTPVLVRHFGEFRRRFGDIWSRSSLGPAVKQFFENGGEKLYIVRVANNARGAMICLPASGSALVLRALEPGSTESVRVAVDYDGIDESDQMLFNLTLQRVDPRDDMIIDQEIFKRLSTNEDTDRFVADVLLSSQIARVEKPYAKHRPNATVGDDNRYELTWVGHSQNGSDGSELSDYDLIGSSVDATGLFALENVENFDLMYLPAPGKNRETGPAAILAAEQYCRRRGAMLIIDPHAQWTSADDAINGMRELGIRSPNALGYFPRIQDRHHNDGEPSTAAGAAIAGLLCKLDRICGPWQAFDGETPALRRGASPVSEMDDAETHALLRAGLNVVAKGSAGQARLRGSVTMACGSEMNRLYSSLPARRLCLRIINTIDLVTRWAVFEKPDRHLAERVREQILAYLESLSELGAFENQSFAVLCDARLPNQAHEPEHGVTSIVSFQPVGSREAVSFTLHQTVLGCRATSTAFAPVSG